MGIIHDLAQRLGRALRDSPENQAFQAARKKAQGDSRAEKVLKEFRAKQVEVTALQMQGKQPGSEQIKLLEKLTQTVQGNPVAREYLEAEVRLGQLWSDVQRLLAESCGGGGSPQMGR